MFPFTLVTSSLDKAREFERMIGEKLAQVSLELPEIQAVDLEPIVAFKVKRAFEALGGRPVLVEDTGLFIEAWNGLPGGLVKWFLDRVGPEGICAMMAGRPDRGASAVTIVATYDGEMRLFTGKVHGCIAERPAGAGGFGWDSIFIPDGATSTYAQLSPTEKDRHSMRRQALVALKHRSPA